MTMKGIKPIIAIPVVAKIRILMIARTVSPTPLGLSLSIELTISNKKLKANNAKGRSKNIIPRFLLAAVFAGSAIVTGC